MGLKNFLGTIGKTAFPFIAGAASIGGPLAVMAASAVGKALGVEKVEPTEQGISQAIADAQIKDPDALLKLQTADQEFQVTMAKLGFDNLEKLAAIDAEDRASARGREMTLRDHTPAMLAAAVTFGFFGLLALLAYHEIPGMAKDIIIAMVGSLGTAWVGIINYYFGSSSGSAAKTAILARQSEK